MSSAAVINATQSSGQTAGSPVTIITDGTITPKLYGTGSGAWSVTANFAPVVGGVVGDAISLTITQNTPNAVGPSTRTDAVQWVGWITAQTGIWSASGIVEGVTGPDAQSGFLGSFAVGALPQYGVEVNSAAMEGGTLVRYGAGVGWVAENSQSNPAIESSTTPRSMGIQLIGDSTGNEIGEWFGVIASDLASNADDYTVEFRTWDFANEQMLRPSVLRMGSLGERSVRQPHSGGAGQSTLGTLNTRTGTGTDLDLRVQFSLDTLSSDSALISNYNSVNTNQRGFTLDLMSTGHLRLRWSSNGASLDRTATSTAASGITANQKIWVRATLDSDNGASGSTTTFYKSNDGDVWTQIGSPVTIATVVPINNAWGYIEFLGYNGNGTSNCVPGNLYRAFMSETIGGFSIIPELPEMFKQIGSGVSNLYGNTAGMVISGSPIFSFVSGSHPGADITFLTASGLRFGKLTPDVGLRTVIVSSNHNEGTKLDAEMSSIIDGLKTKIISRIPYCVVCMITQNPKIGDSAQYNISQDLRRGVYARYCKKNAWHLVDTFAAFPIFPHFLAYLLPDEKHPNPAGSRLIADFVKRALGLA